MHRDYTEMRQDLLKIYLNLWFLFRNFSFYYLKFTEVFLRSSLWWFFLLLSLFQSFNVAPPFVSPSERRTAFTWYKSQLSRFHSFCSYSLLLCLTEKGNTTGSYWTRRFTTKIENWDSIKALEFIVSCRRQEHKNTWEKLRNYI